MAAAAARMAVNCIVVVVGLKLWIVSEAGWMDCWLAGLVLPSDPRLIYTAPPWPYSLQAATRASDVVALSVASGC